MCAYVIPCSATVQRLQVLGPIAEGTTGLTVTGADSMTHELRAGSVMRRAVMTLCTCNCRLRRHLEFIRPSKMWPLPPSSCRSVQLDTPDHAKMRLIAVPLARVRPSAHPISTFVAQTASRAAEKAMAEAAKKEGAKSGQPFATRMLNKASAFWVDLGRTDQKSTFDWKRRTYVTGEKLMDRIEYQEWALKGIDPAMGPHFLRGGQDESMREKDDNGIPKIDHIPLLYPSSVLKPESLLDNLKNLTDHRTPHHYKRFWYCVVGMPLTIPFALIRKSESLILVRPRTNSFFPQLSFRTCRSSTWCTGHGAIGKVCGYASLGLRTACSQWLP